MIDEPKTAAYAAARLLTAVLNTLERTPESGVVITVTDDDGNAAEVDWSEIEAQRAWVCEEGLDYERLAKRLDVPRSEEETLLLFGRLATERERLIYWACRALRIACGPAEPKEHLDLQRGLNLVLLDLDYDMQRVARMIDMGEPRKKWRTGASDEQPPPCDCPRPCRMHPNAWCAAPGKDEP